MAVTCQLIEATVVGPSVMADANGSWIFEAFSLSYLNRQSW